MAKQNFNDLINQAKSNNQEKTLQKVIPVDPSRIKEVQFSFYMEKELLKKIKMKALEEETSIKRLLIKIIKDYLE